MTIECLIRICVVFLPNTVTYTHNPVNLTVQMVSYTVVLFAHEASSIISTTLALALQTFIGWHIVFLKPFTVAQIITDVIIVVLYFISVSIFAVMIQYMKQLQIRLRVSNES